MYSEKRELPDFDSLWLKSVGNVIVEKSDKQEVRIESDQNVVSKLKTDVKDGQLIIKVKEAIPLWLAGMPRLDIYVKMKEIKLLKISGVGHIRSEGEIVQDQIIIINNGVGGMHLKLKAEILNSELSGVGEIELHGKTNKHFINVSGTGKVDAYHLESEEVDIKNSGVGECVVFVNKDLHVRSSGIGRVRYRGEASVQGSQTGLGGIERIA